MIDATKLVDGERYYVLCNDTWYNATYRKSAGGFCAVGLFAVPDSVTDAIPIPSPDELAKMREVIDNVVSGIVTNHTMQTARTLLEKRT